MQMYFLPPSIQTRLIVLYTACELAFNVKPGAIFDVF